MICIVCACVFRLFFSNSIDTNTNSNRYQSLTENTEWKFEWNLAKKKVFFNLNSMWKWSDKQILNSRFMSLVVLAVCFQLIQLDDDDDHIRYNHTFFAYAQNKNSKNKHQWPNSIYARKINRFVIFFYPHLNARRWNDTSHSR